MTEPTPIVEMKNISIEFPGVKALQDVNFRLLPGEVHALMGENGAGKSTLIKALTGVYEIDAGTIVVDGTSRSFSATADAQNAGIATVYQEVNLCTNLSIGENVMLGHEVRGPLGINWRKTHEQARHHLSQLELNHIDPRNPLSSLSIAMQQLVAIARATVLDAKVLILDEPTSSLDENEVAKLFAVVRQLRAQGVAILFVSHFLDQIYELSDRMTVLRNGQFVGEYLTAELPRFELISLMIGKDLKALTSLERRAEQLEAATSAPPILQVQKLGKTGTLKPVSLDIVPGTVTGFAGLLGSGRTELAKLIFGADRPSSGTTILHGGATKISNPAVALRSGLAYSTENRRDEGIVGDLTVRENIVLALQAIRGWTHPIPRKEQDELCDKYIKELNIRPADPEKSIKNLSGGNQQKVLLARWLATNPDILILDEPTRGIDVGAKTEIQEIILSLVEGGMSIIFISSELEEVVRLCDRILVMKDRGVIAELGNAAHIDADYIINVIAEGGEAA